LSTCWTRFAWRESTQQFDSVRCLSPVGIPYLPIIRTASGCTPPPPGPLSGLRGSGRSEDYRGRTSGLQPLQFEEFPRFGEGVRPWTGGSAHSRVRTRAISGGEELRLA